MKHHIKYASYTVSIYRAFISEIEAVSVAGCFTECAGGKHGIIDVLRAVLLF